MRILGWPPLLSSGSKTWLQLPQRTEDAERACLQREIWFPGDSMRTKGIVFVEIRCCRKVCLLFMPTFYLFVVSPCKHQCDTITPPPPSCRRKETLFALIVRRFRSPLGTGRVRAPVTTLKNFRARFSGGGQESDQFQNLLCFQCYLCTLVAPVVQIQEGCVRVVEPAPSFLGTAGAALTPWIRGPINTTLINAFQIKNRDSFEWRLILVIALV